MLSSVEHYCSETTVNRKLSTISVFYQHAARHGVDLGELITGGHRGAWKPFLHHISKSAPKSRRTVKLPTTSKLPRLLTATEVQTILDSCEYLRDRLLFALLDDTGMFSGDCKLTV